MANRKKKQPTREEMRGIDPNAPKGVSFYNTKSGETRYAKSSAQIQAYVNSSNMGINASRGQDYGWKLGAEWVKRIRRFREDEDKMDTLAAKLRLDDGVSPSDMQIILYIYGRQIRAYARRKGENEETFEQQYLQDVNEDDASDDDPEDSSPEA